MQIRPKYFPSAVIGALIIFIGSASAEAGSATSDIPFRDIFDVLTAKVDNKSPQEFFENEVLRGLATKEANPWPANSYKYSYGSELSGKSSTYTIQRNNSSAHVVFLASDFSNENSDNCISFREAFNQLQARGWTAHDNPELAQPVIDGTVDVREYYTRNGVTIIISFFNFYLPFPERWNSAEFNENARKKGIANAAADQNISRGSDAYEKRCVNNVVAEFDQ